MSGDARNIGGPGDKPPEEFVEQVRHALDHLYDFTALQHHPLIHQLQMAADTPSPRMAAQDLRRTLIDAIEVLNPGTDIAFFDPRARVYNLLLLHYVEGMTIQETANELGISGRQMYRDLRTGSESVATILWESRRAATSKEPRAIDLSSVETEMNRLESEPQPVEMCTLIERAYHAVQPLAAQRRATIALALPTEPVIVLADPVVAQQVLVNLLSYAVKQAQPGSLELALALVDQEASLTFRYTPDPDARRIEVTTLPGVQIAERLGWNVQQARQAEDGQLAVTLQISAQGPVILVVDDNEGLVQLLQRYLTEHASQVAVATSGQEGLRLAENLLPAAIILDVMMPEMDGWEFLQRLRMLPKVGTTPVVICSVFDDPELAYSLGATSFLPKPISRHEILEVLYELGVVKRGVDGKRRSAQPEKLQELDRRSRDRVQVDSTAGKTSS